MLVGGGPWQFEVRIRDAAAQSRRPRRQPARPELARGPEGDRDEVHRTGKNRAPAGAAGDRAGRLRLVVQHLPATQEPGCRAGLSSRGDRPADAERSSSKAGPKERYSIAKSRNCKSRRPISMRRLPSPPGGRSIRGGGSRTRNGSAALLRKHGLEVVDEGLAGNADQAKLPASVTEALGRFGKSSAQPTAQVRRLRLAGTFIDVLAAIRRIGRYGDAARSADQPEHGRGRHAGTATRLDALGVDLRRMRDEGES